MNFISSFMTKIIFMHIAVKTLKKFYYISNALRIGVLVLLFTNCSHSSQDRAAEPNTVFPYDTISIEQRNKLTAIRDSIGSITGLDSLYTNYTHPNGLPYHVCIPKNLMPNKDYPLVIFLHGHSDLTLGTHKGFPKGIWSLPRIQNNHPHILFIPRHRTNNDRWTDDSYRAMFKEVLDELIKKINDDPNQAHIDTNRIYLTGFSKGGMGTWDYIKHYPDKFAAAVPLSGFFDGPQSVDEASKIKHIPTWIFNGDGDGGIEGSRISYQMLKRAEAIDVRYHEYASQGHVIDDFAYFTPGFLDWLFSQKK